MTSHPRSLRPALVLALAGAAFAADGLPAPICELAFDGSPDAARAGGQAKPVKAEGIAFAEGVRGQAVVVGGKGTLEYACPGNLVQEHGTITLWYRPDWRGNAVDTAGANWHTLLSQPYAEPRAGSGALMFWFWGPHLRADLSDRRDSYRTASAEGLDPGRWTHLACSWDVDGGSRMYRDGHPVGVKSSDSESPLDPKRAGGFPELRNHPATFRIGSQGAWAAAGGRIDEVRIYDRALAPEQVLADLALVSPLVLDCPPAYAPAGQELRTDWTLTNRGAAEVAAICAWRIIDTQGKELASGSEDGAPIRPGESRACTARAPAASAGGYHLVVRAGPGPEQIAALWVLGGDDRLATPAGSPLAGRQVARIDFAAELPADRFVASGACRRGELGGRGYLEAGGERHDRFAVRVDLPAAGVPYLVEWDYPDDRLRSIDFVGQEAMRPDSDYGLQAGVLCGDEYPNSGKMRTHRALFWARATSAAFVFMTARTGAPAAVAELRVSEVAGLPDAGVSEPPPVDGWTRSLGMYFEDPSLGYDFGVDGQLMPGYERTLDRLVAYLRWSGQNLLAYPAVWYQGRIGPGYQPRLHPDGFITAILAKFAANRLGFMPTINLQNIDLAPGTVTATSIADGSLHASPVMIYADGKPNPGGWHGTLPNFNPLHPAVRAFIDGEIDDLLARHGGSPAFKGIILHLTKHTIPWFGGLEAGYNDYAIAAFERDTGIHVPVDHAAPLRGKLYADWLLANAREKWIDWRCRQLAEWWRAMAGRLAARRPDLRLVLCSYNPTLTDHSQDPRFADPGFARDITRESGLDPALLAGIPNLVLTQTTYPADYRWSAGESWLERARPASRLDFLRPGTYALLDHAALPWVNMHDRYFEDAVGAQAPLKAPWLREMPWRVSTLNPSAGHELEPWVAALRSQDALGITKGGFLVGTCGHEERLAAFARAYRALPAVRFADLPGAPGDVRVRVLARPDAAWFYAVNTGREPARVALRFAHPPAALAETAAATAPHPDGARLVLDLQPYQLRAFKAAAGELPSGWE